MAGKAATKPTERIGRLGQRRQVVIPRDIIENLRMTEGDFVAISQKGNVIVVKPTRLTDSDDVLTPAEGALLRKAEREVRQGKFVTLAQLNHELARKRSSRSRKTA